MDVAESGSAFVVTVELPGVSADGICCEVTPDRWKLFFHLYESLCVIYKFHMSICESFCTELR
jgi:hypothetical protein